jgi:glycosyltransferase involved in cell wall biosynthesis
MLAMVASRSRSVDLLNPHNLPGPVVAALIGPARHIPVVWNLNEVPVPLPPDQARHLGLIERSVWVFGAVLSRWAARVPGAILVLDEKTQRSVREHYGLEATVAMPGLRVEAFGGDGRHRPISAGRVELLTVGKLHPQKNVALAIETAAMLKRRGRDVGLTIIGSGPLRDELGALAERLGLSDVVRFRSGLSLDELARCYAESDVLLVTPTGHQAWGLTPFEGIAAGVPSVVSNEAGASEILAARDAAVVVTPERSAFADAVELLLEDPRRAAELLRNGRALLHDELTWSMYADRCERVFRAALDQHV